MSAQTHNQILTSCIDDFDALSQRIKHMLTSLIDDEPAYFTLLSILNEHQRINKKLRAKSE